MDLAELTSCLELGAEHADAAALSAARFRAVLARAAEIAQPEEGAPKILFVLARLARGDVAWLDGEVTIEIHGDDAVTVIDVYKEEGWGIRERLAPQTRFVVPFDEFSRAIEISAKRFAPLRASTRGDTIVLSNAKETGGKAPDVALDERSVGTAPPPAGLPAVPMEPEPFAMPAASEPEPFEAYPVDDEAAALLPIIDPKKPAIPPAEPTREPKLPPAPKPKQDPVHSRPTVRRMVAIKPEALRTGRKDPRREDDE